MSVNQSMVSEDGNNQNVYKLTNEHIKCGISISWKIIGYLSIKRKKVLTHTATWMNLDIMLNEKSQSQKPTYCVTPFIQNAQHRHFIERHFYYRNRKYMSHCTELGRGGWRQGREVATESRVSLCRVNIF